MASRINTKFLLLLITIVGALAITVAGIAFFTMRDDPTRNLRRADDFIAKGDYPAAKVQLERAWSKAETDMDIMKKFEDVLLKIQPRTSGEANEYYNQLLLVKRQRIIVRPQDIELHRDYLDELYSNARLTKSPSAWNQLANAADEAMARAGEGTEAYEFDQIYKLRADSNRQSILSADELAALREKFLEYVRTNPQDTESAVELITFLLREAEAQLIAQNPQAARADLELAREIHDASLAATDAKNADLAIANARLVLAGWFFDQGERPEAEIEAAADRLLASMDGDASIARLNEAGGILPRLKGREGSELAISLFEDAVEKDPSSFIERYLICEQLDQLGQLDQLEPYATSIVESEPLSVSYLATYRFELRKEAAKMLFDVANARLGQAAPDERASLLEEAEAARDFLSEITADDDLRVVEADAWLAMAENDAQLAASKFNEVATRHPRPDLRTLWGFARALQSTGATGEAADVFERALTLNPRNVGLMIESARLEVMLGRIEPAQELLAKAKEIDPDNPQIDLVLSSIDAREGNEISNPLVRMMQEASQSMDRGDYETARALLVDGYKEYPTNASVVALLTRVELALDMKESAVARLEELVDRYPNNPDVLNLMMEIRGDDPVQRIENVVALQYPDDEATRVARTAVVFATESKRESQRAEQLESEGLVEEASTASDLALRLAAKAEEYRGQAESLGSTDLAFLDQQFSNAIQSGDLQEAERITDRARTANADQANGLSFEARLQIANGAYESAVITLDDVTRLKPYDPWAWRTLGQVYQKIGNLTDANTAFERAYEVRPNDVDTVLSYSQFLLDTGQSRGALVVLRESAERLNSEKNLQERWLLLEAQFGNPVLAIETRERRFKEDPEDQVNALRLVELLSKTEPQRSTFVDDDGEPTYDDREWSSLGTAGRQRVFDEKRSEWDDLAESVLATLESNQNDSISAVFARATYLRNRGKVEEGAQLLDQFITEKENEGNTSSMMYIALSNYFLAINAKSEAYNAAMRGLPRQDDSKRLIDRTLANGFIGDGNFEEGYKHLLKFAEVNNDEQTQILLLQTEVNMGDYPAAEKRLKSIRETYGNNSNLELLSAGIARGQARQLLAAGRESDAEKAFREERLAIQRAIQLAPTEPWPYAQQATSILGEARRSSDGRFVLLQDALASIDRALQIDPNFVHALKVRADILMSQQPPDSIAAMSQLQRAIELDPLDNQLRTSAIRAYVSLNQLSNAMQLAEEGARLQPRSDLWYRSIGELHEMQGNNEQALAAYLKAFDLSKGPGDLVRWSRVMLRSGGQSAGQEVLAKLLENQPQLESSPALQTFAAHALKRSNRWDDAKKAMQGAFEGYKKVAEMSNRPRAVEVWYTEVFNLFEGKSAADLEEFIFATVGDEPNYVDLFWVGKAWLYRDSDGASRAAELFSQSLAKMKPDDQGRSDVYIALGQAEFFMGDHQAAVDAYREVIKEEPDNGSVLNDLSYILATDLDRPEEALPLAQQAVELLPTNANVLDTLGTVQLQLGQLDEAEQTLIKSINIEAMAGNQFHLAQVFIGLERPREAEQLLIAARNLNPDPKMLKEIEALLADIQQ